MSRVAKKPVDLPQGVSATIGADAVTVKGAKGTLTLSIKSGIKVVQKDKHLEVEADSSAEGLNAIAGSTRATSERRCRSTGSPVSPASRTRTRSSFPLR